MSSEARRAEVVASLRHAAAGQPIYLASPYSHADRAVEQERFEQVCIAAGRLMLEGLAVYSPIAHNHSIAQVHLLPRDWEWWQPHCLSMLEHCGALAVLQLPGVATSKGVKAELAMADDLGLVVAWLPSVDWVAGFTAPAEG